jgi:hypothetical protein
MKAPIPFESVVRDTKVGSKIRACHNALRAGYRPPPWTIDGPYVGMNAMTVARFFFEHGKWWAVTEGGGYFSSWILVR